MKPVAIAEAQPRHRHAVGGRIIAITVEPAGSTPALRARISDGTGDIDVTFLGRSTIPGIEPGQHIAVEGRVMAGPARLAMVNPRYELTCRP